MSTLYLITGGAGNLACQIAQRYAAAGSRVVLCDVAARPLLPLPTTCEYVACDITAPAQVDRVIAQFRPAVILHFASLLSGKSEENRPLAWQVNLDGAFFLLEAALRHGVRQVFFPSSVAAYGGPLPTLVPEDFPQWPHGLYGVTKAAVERLGVYYRQKHGLDFRALRLPVVISPHAPSGAASAYASRAFVEAIERSEYTFRVRPGARPSLIYVQDVLTAMMQLIAAPSERLTRAVYNIQALSPTAEEIAAAIRARLPGVRLAFDPLDEVADLIESWPIELVDASARRDWHWRPQFDLHAMADDLLRELELSAKIQA